MLSQGAGGERDEGTSEGLAAAPAAADGADVASGLTPGAANVTTAALCVLHGHSGGVVSLARCDRLADEPPWLETQFRPRATPGSPQPTSPPVGSPYGSPYGSPRFGSNSWRDAGCVLASGGYDGSVRLWDMAPLLRSVRERDIRRDSVSAATVAEPPLRVPEACGVLAGHGAWVTEVVFLGMRLASASYDCTVRVWRAADEHIGGERRGHGGGSGGGGDASPSTPPPPLILRHDHPVAALCGLGCGTLLAAGGYDHVVHIW